MRRVQQANQVVESAAISCDIGGICLDVEIYAKLLPSYSSDEHRDKAAMNAFVVDALREQGVV